MLVEDVLEMDDVGVGDFAEKGDFSEGCLGEALEILGEFDFFEGLVLACFLVD